jgi:hypothetical protein
MDNVSQIAVKKKPPGGGGNQAVSKDHRQWGKAGGY